jgi:transcriptional regulator with XRE-family HTH domain
MKEINKMLNKSPWNVKLAVLRVINGFEMKEIAEKCCVHPRIYQHWEHGRFKPHPRNRAFIAKIYSVPEKEIFG